MVYYSLLVIQYCLEKNVALSEPYYAYRRSAYKRIHVYITVQCYRNGSQHASFITCQITLFRPYFPFFGKLTKSPPPPSSTSSPPYIPSPCLLGTCAKVLTLLSPKCESSCKAKLQESFKLVIDN